MVTRKLYVLRLLTIIALSVAYSSSVWAESDPAKWPVLKEAFFANKEIADAPFIKLTAPRRAESGAQVPLEIAVDQTQADANAVKTIYVLVDANPIPMTATYHLTEKLGKFNLATRIRMEMDSYVRVVGETADGKLYMSSIEIRAAGGCGGTVDGDDAAVRAQAGKIKLNVESPVKFGEPTSTTFIIKHPMRTGLQRDLVSQGYVPAFYIKQATFTYNDKPVMNVDFGVGTSEDPYLRFNFIPDAPGTLEVKAVDSEGKAFSHETAVKG
jgi:sulfur-oxidizing protein SoxY